MRDNEKELRELEFRRKLQELKHAPVETVDDFQKPAQKDMKVDHINTKAPQKLTSGEEFAAKQRQIALQREAKGTALELAKNTKSEGLDYNAMRKQAAKLGRMKAIAPIAGAVGALADVKEGMPNTAAARMVTGLAPMGSEQLQDDLMQRAQLEDKSPYLLDPSYQQTLKNIGARRQREGRSPVVEAFGGEQVDTSATENSDYLNKLKAHLQNRSQG